MTEHEYTIDEDKDFPKRPTVIMNSKEQIIKVSKNFDEGLAEILNDVETRAWDSFLKEKEGKNQK